MIDGLSEFIKADESRTWLILLGIVVSAITAMIMLVYSRIRKPFETERYKMFMEGEMLSETERILCNQSPSEFKKWFADLSDEDKKRIRRDRGFELECKMLQQNHLGDSYFRQLARLNDWLTKVIGDQPQIIEHSQNWGDRINRFFLA